MTDSLSGRETTALRESFRDGLAIVTGGGTGMGRELVIQLAAEGCNVAVCDLIPGSLAETADRAAATRRPGVRITTHLCDVAVESQVLRFRDEVVSQHRVDHVTLVFNNAGIHGTGSFINGSRDEWDRIFAVCWTGVYNCSRAFVPLLVASASGWLVNTSSVNGLWASHSAYSAAKFAVRGFSEALIEDFRVNAPHVKVAVVIPGYIGTDIVYNSRNILAGDGGISETQRTRFRENAPVSATSAATIILDHLRAGMWRILIGSDAEMLDKRVRADPFGAYEPKSSRLDTNSGGAPARPIERSTNVPTD